MNPVLTAAAAALILALLRLLLQKEMPVYAALLSAAAAVFLLLRIGTAVEPVIRRMLLLGQQADGQAFACLLRCAGILLLTDYVRTFCEETGARSLGWCVGLAGRCLVLAAAWPLLEKICEEIWSLGG